MATRRPAAPGRTRKPNRVDGIRALDKNPTGQRTPARGRAGARQALAGRPQAGAPQAPAGPGAPRPPMAPAPGLGQHFWLSGTHLGAMTSEKGSPPGTPNLGAAVMRSFQPSVLERTPLVGSGAGVPTQGTQGGMTMNPGQQAFPQNMQGMVPQQGAPPVSQGGY